MWLPKPFADEPQNKKRSNQPEFKLKENAPPPIADGERIESKPTTEIFGIDKFKSIDTHKQGRVLTKNDIEQLLNQRMKAEFVDTPLKNVIDSIADLNNLPIIIEEKSFEELGETLDKPINLIFDSVKIRDILRIIQKDFGIITITADNGFARVKLLSEEALYIKSYDISVIVKRAVQNDPAISEDLKIDNKQSASLGTNQNVNTAPTVIIQNQTSAKIKAANRLITLLQKSVSGPWLEIDKKGSSIMEFDGKLIINATFEQHEMIEHIIELLTHVDESSY
jgi:hypothetical protein